MKEDTEEFKRMVRKELKAAVKRFYDGAKRHNYKIMTPGNGYGIIYEYQSIRDGKVDYLQLIKPKLTNKTNKSVFFLENTIKTLVDESELEKAKNNKGWEHIAIFKWTPHGPDRFLKDYGVMGYEFYPQVFYYNPTQQHRKNCYLEKERMSDLVSVDTFDAFKDLYNFSKL